MTIVATEKAVAACPLCASKAQLRTNGEYKPRFWVKCDDPDCGCTTDSGKDEAEALARWNRRW